MAFESLSEKLGSIFKGLRSRGKLSESDVKEAMRQIKLALLSADVNFLVVKDFVAQVSQRAMGAEVLESLTPAQQVIKIVNEELTSFMGSDNDRIKLQSGRPTVIMLCGLQGAGKTTHGAKLALHFKNLGRRPLLVACDVYRPAAVKQLQLLADKISVPVYQEGTDEDPVKIAKNAVRHAKDHGNDIIILDTAGRLHIDEQLMNELKNIKKAVEPSEILLTVDAMTGQDAVNVAKEFDEALGITGVILTKTDGDSRGGAALSVRHVTGKPIKFVGTGEKLGDLEQFHADRMASRILGMGDVLTLIEKAEQAFDEKQAEELQEKLRSSRYDFNDYLQSMRQIKKMGPLENILSMMPGVDKKALQNVKIDDKQLAHIEALILSMTEQERSNPELINPSRKRRIAAGAGRSVEEVNRMLKGLEQMKQMMKRFNPGSAPRRRKKKKK